MSLHTGWNKAVGQTSICYKNQRERELIGLFRKLQIERNKRLESLIARQKARKLFSLQWLVFTRGRFPSRVYESSEQGHNVLQPQEFQFRASLPREFMQDCADTSVFRDFGLRQRASKGIECSKPGNQLDSEFNMILEPEQFQEPEPKTKVDSADDQIKEVIQVREQVNITMKKIMLNCQTKLIPIEDVNDRPSSSSSKEDEPFYKRDKDAILKSLASPATRIVAEDRLMAE
ncbi:unnamed protein product [Fraxinus pennsylvanica]|uniref:Uncharacterized protein n=1 Tax=Fraxinus pennsylvanica TaxID=56036 RepID=A0AAD1ZZW9_9LAMI|nr:unnamed protein product [Fraxinus pennsylvanica]